MTESGPRQGGGQKKCQGAMGENEKVKTVPIERMAAKKTGSRRQGTKGVGK